MKTFSELILIQVSWLNLSFLFWLLDMDFLFMRDFFDGNFDWLGWKPFQMEKAFFLSFISSHWNCFFNLQATLRSFVKLV